MYLLTFEKRYDIIVTSIKYIRYAKQVCYERQYKNIRLFQR